MSQRIKYISQLDALRAVAALLVIFYHFLPALEIGKFAFGKYGVQIFFTISGFLITSILLEQKQANLNKILIIKNFIIKRALRLFPIYYLVLLLCTILSISGLYFWEKGEAVFYYTYTTNILFFIDGMGSIQLNHMWTLAVEEQFYLLWPWLLIFIPCKKEWIAIVAFILFSILFKLTTHFTNSNMLTISHFDTLGAGALLAYVTKYTSFQVLNLNGKFKLINFSIILLILLFYVINTFVVFNTNINGFIILTLSTLLVLGCHLNFYGLFGWVLNLSVLKYLGQISYGLYLYHKFVPYFLTLFLNKYGLKINSIILLIFSLIITILISHLSYIYVEKKFIRLKEKFDL